MLKLRSKALLLAFGVCVTTMFGLNAAVVQEAGCTACKPRKKNDIQIMDAACAACKPRKKSDVQVLDAACDRCKPRPLPAELEVSVYKNMAKKALKTQNMIGGSELLKKDVITTLQTRALCASKGYVFSRTPNYLHERSPQGDTVTVENGSAWSIAEKDQSKVLKWEQGQTLMIVPNSLSLWQKVTRQPLKYKYRLVNLKNNQSAQTNIALGPFVHNPHTLRIRKINHATGEVALTNGTLWRIDTSKISSALVNEWQQNDFIMTGANNTWFGLGFPDILINVSSDNWLPSQRLY